MDHVDLGNGPAVDGPSQRGLALLLPEDGLDGAILEVDQLLENLSALEMLDAAEGRFVLVQRRRWDVAAIPVDEDGTSASFPNVLFDAPANSIVVLVGQPEIAAALINVKGFEEKSNKVRRSSSTTPKSKTQKLKERRDLIEKQMERNRKSINILSCKLETSDFLEKAPNEVVEHTKAALDKRLKRQEALLRNLEDVNKGLLL